MECTFNKNDYLILNTLIKNKCYSPLESLTIKQLSSATTLSIPKIRMVIKTFILMGILHQGAKDGIGNTFFITSKGVEFYNKAMGVENNTDIKGED